MRPSVNRGTKPSKKAFDNELVFTKAESKAIMESAVKILPTSSIAYMRLNVVLNNLTRVQFNELCQSFIDKETEGDDTV